MSLTLDDEPIGRRRVLIYTSSDECEEAVVIADFGNGMIKARTSDGKIWIGNRWEDLSGPFAPIRRGVKHLQQGRTPESAFPAQRPLTLGPNMEGSIQSDYFERLKSRDPIPTERVLHLLGFTESGAGGYERKWGRLEVSCTKWLGSWHFICSWVTPREMGNPEFRVGPSVSPAGLLATLYSQCGDAFRRSALGLPNEFVIGKEEQDYQRKTRALTPQAPTVWADRKFLRFCCNYIGSRLSGTTGAYTLTLSVSNGQLRIDCVPQPFTICCPVTGEWLGASEIAADDLFERLPKRFSREFIALRQQGDRIIIDSRIVPSRFVETV